MRRSYPRFRCGNEPPFDVFLSGYDSDRACSKTTDTERRMTVSKQENRPDTEEQSSDTDSDQAVATRAYEISQSDRARTPEEDWERAVQELRDGGPTDNTETPES
jgi:hypothetical protein